MPLPGTPHIHRFFAESSRFCVHDQDFQRILEMSEGAAIKVSATIDCQCRLQPQPDRLLMDVEDSGRLLVLARRN